MPLPQSLRSSSVLIMSYVDNLAETTPLVQKATTKPLRVSALIVSLAALCLACGAVVSRTTLSPGNSGKVEQLDTISYIDAGYEGNYSLSRTNETISHSPRPPASRPPRSERYMTRLEALPHSFPTTATPSQ